MAYRLLKLHTLEPGATAPRKRGMAKVDTIVVHYIAFEFARWQSKASVRRRLLVAVDKGHVEAKQAEEFERQMSSRYHTADVSDGAAMAPTAASTDRLACSHYYVASSPGDDELTDVSEFCPIETACHHVGEPELPTNQRSVGVELCYPGPAPRRFGLAEAEDWFREQGYPPELVRKMRCPGGELRYFATPGQMQVDALVLLLVDICRRVPTVRAITSHYLWAQTKRIDPDPPYDLARIRAQVGSLVGCNLVDDPRKG